MAFPISEIPSDVIETPTYHLRLSGPYPLNQLDRLVGALMPLERLDQPTRVTLDLSGLARMSAPVLAAFVSTVRDLAAKGRLAEGSRLVPPKNFLIRRWLERMDAFQLILQSAPPEDFERRPEHGFRPCQVFRDENERDATTVNLIGALSEACETDYISAQAIWFALNEITTNVTQHARSVSGAVAIAQASMRRGEFEVAIADRGVGIRASLMENPQHAEIAGDLDALKVALEAGTSARSDDSRRGLGLFVTRALLRANGGSLFLRSGTAQLELGAASEERLGLAEVQGTLVALRFRMDRPVAIAPLLKALGIDP